MGVSLDAELTAVEKLAVAPVLSVTCAVKRYDPAVVGVPDINPLSESSVSPVGRCPAVVTQVYGGVAPEAGGGARDENANPGGGTGVVPTVQGGKARGRRRPQQ